MKPNAFQRALALFLCVQPMLWMSNVALAQAFQPQTPQQAAQAAQAGQMGQTQAQQQVQQQLQPQQAQPGIAFPVPQLADDFKQGGSSTGLSGVAGQGQGTQGLLLGQQPAIPVDEPLDPQRYLCGPGDVLDLNFWGLQNIRTRVTIDLEGRAFVPKVGYLRLAGLTLAEARRAVQEAVARYYPKLNFDLGIAEPRTFVVQVVDDVAHPGSYQARGVERVLSAIGRAGGFGTGASLRRIELRRRDGAVSQVDLLLYAQTGDVKHNPYLLDGDVIRVPFEEVAASVSGAVNRPGRYELVGSRDLEELVALAGGLAPTATRRLPVRVFRRTTADQQEKLEYPFPEGEGPPKVQVSHEDVVVIPGVNELQPSVFVIGAVTGATATDEVSATRRLPFAQGDTVRTLLERVGGVGQLADLENSYIARGGQALSVDLYKLLVLKDLTADRPVELGDSVVVPFMRRNVLVQGAVMAPGIYPYHPTFGVSQYLSLAGGMNRNSQGYDEVKMVTPSGEMVPNKPDLRPPPGASLVVPERNFSRAEVVQIILSVASILISGVAVVITATR